MLKQPELSPIPALVFSDPEMAADDLSLAPYARSEGAAVITSLGSNSLRSVASVPFQAPEAFENQTSTDDYYFNMQLRVDGLLHDFIGKCDESVQAYYDYALLSRAKRLRPILAFITADTFAVERERVDEVAVAAELLHTASLIFDDMPAQDNADLRRSKATLHIVHGEGEAQVAGLAMIFDTQQLIANADATHGMNGDLVKYINGALGSHGLCKGQLQDLKAIKQPETVTSIDQLDEYSYLKTGLAIELSVISVAMIGRLPKSTVETLKEFAYHLGIAFQVKDDLLDGGNAIETGKTSGLDIRNGKATYVSLLGSQVSEQKLNYHVQQAFEILEELEPEVNSSQYRRIVEYIAG